MSTTNTDAVSIIVTLLGCGLAIYGIVSEPLVVDSSRPTQTGEAGQAPAEVPAYARLWDDPFAVYQDTDKVKPPKPSLFTTGRTLVLIVPTKTQPYEDDIENRIRIRYAIERALFDQGYAAEAGNLLSTIDIGSPIMDTGKKPDSDGLVQVSTLPGTQNEPGPDHHSLPIQIFRLCPLTAQLFVNTGHKPFESVAVVWLPDAHLWEEKPLAAIQSIYAAFRRSKANLDEDRWVLLGPSDSDSLAYFNNRSQKNFDNRSQENMWTGGLMKSGLSQISSPGEYPSKLWLIPFRASVSESILRVLRQEGSLSASRPGVSLAATQETSTAPHWTFSELRQTDVVPIRLPIRDDILCAALIREITERGSLPPHTNTINVTVFAEWDTLYGRGLADTFRAMATGGAACSDTEKDYYADLSKSITTELARYQYPLPCPQRSIRITLIPYLRGLDGASTLYRKNYVALRAVKEGDKEKPDHNQNSHDSIEPAEGTTQFDYIRRLVNSMYLQKAPFWPQVERPDAIVIFGTDVYDKLALLKFLRQALKNCAYFTTDLDALYWHSHYIQYTKDLIVASSFPLRMSPNRTEDWTGCRGSGVPIEFRDSYQSAAYWTVTRCLTEGEDLQSNHRFDHTDWPIIYRVGNTKPLPISDAGTVPVETPSSESSFSGLLEGLGGFLNSVTEPIIQGASPFWSICLQLTVIILGLYALLVDVSKRMLLRREVADELWNSALAFVPSTLHEKIRCSRDAIRARFREVSLRRKPWHPRSPLEVGGPALRPGEPKDLTDRASRIIEYYIALVEKTVCQLELIEVALCYLSALFALRTPGGPKLTSAESPGKFAADIQPFADYVNRDVTKPPIVADESKEKLPAYRALVRNIFQFLNRRFPNAEFILVGAVVFSMLIALCLQPVPFLVGPETHSYAVRVLRWIVEGAALLITFLLFHRVCYEQYRFRKLVEDLETLVTKNTGLSNRQLVVLIAEASDPVANLSFLPCALTLLIFLSHLRPLGGVPFTMEMSLVMFVGLGTLTYAYGKLRAAALRCRAAVRAEYKKQQVDAARLETRLKSYLTDAGPLQDNECSLIVELKQFLERNTTILPEQSLTLLDKPALSRSGFRERLCDYLEQTIKRNIEVIDQLGEIRSGMLAPIAINPIVSALMIPVGGAGGLTLIQWLITQAR
jgi:hypothetical protein